MNIYLIDNTIDLNSEGEKKFITDDTGRTGKLRNILDQIKKNSSQILVNALVQVYTQVPQNDDCGKAALLNLTPPFILFIHTSNGCSKEFLEDLFSKKNGLGSSWIACYSGGDEPDWYENLGTNSFKNIRFFRHIGDDVESKWDIPAFVSAVLDKKEKAFDYLVRKPKSHLIALSILCQGYLAVKDPDKIKFTNKIDLTNKDINIPVNWWEPAFSPGDVFENTDVSKEIKALGEDAPAGITNLFIKKKEPTADLVFEAYKSLSEILKA